jgi:excisionase family DNA binding protein
MSDEQTIKSAGGIAPFGYAWQNGNLVIDETEVPIRRLIYELFLKHRRKKTVAKLLNDLGYRTRNDALFSDTTIDRLLRDTTAKGIKFIDGRETKVPAIISEDIWQRANNFLGTVKTKQTIHLFAGFAFCICGGKMIMPSSSAKYVCLNCRHKINADDLEEIFSSQLSNFRIELGDGLESSFSEFWQDFTQKEKRIIIEQILEKIIIGKTDIAIEFGYTPHSHKTAAVGQQIERGNETPNNQAKSTNPPSLNEPLMNEIEAAKFLGISRMTLLRRRKANEIGFYRVGFRILYSKEKHLIPFLEQCEK